MTTPCHRLPLLPGHAPKHPLSTAAIALAAVNTAMATSRILFNRH